MASNPSAWSSPDLAAPSADNRRALPPSVTIGDGETLFVDEARYAMTGRAEAGDFDIPYDGTPGFDVGDEILIVTMMGPNMGTFDFNRIDEIHIEDGELELDEELQNDYDSAIDAVQVQVVPLYDEVTVECGGVITAHAWDGATGGIVAFRADELTVNDGGRIDASALGFRAGEGPGSGGFKAGGGYGGYGQDHGDQPGGVGYGPPEAPFMLGSAGGDVSEGINEGSEAGRPGGGIVFISVEDHLQLDGSLRADGGSASNPFGSDGPGAGAGGSVSVRTDSMAGVGAMHANGASSSVGFEFVGYFGAGSGGRLSLHYRFSEFEGSLSAWGGFPGGGAGTILIHDLTSGQKTLRVDNLGRDGRPALLTDPDPTTWSFDLVELLRDGDLELLDPGDRIELRPEGMAGDGSGQLHIPDFLEFSEPSISGFGLFAPAGSELALPATFELQGVELDVYGTLSGLQNLTLAADGSRNSRARLAATGSSASADPGTYSLASIVVQADQTLELAADPVNERALALIVDRLEVHTGGHVSADGFGYPGGEDAGPGAPGGHGGYGGGDAGGAPYGEALQPTTLGSAGQGSGGGAAHLVVSDLTVDGTLSADGAPATERGTGGGAGGSLWIEAESLSGSGSIRANGADRDRFTVTSAPGAGGRIAIYATSNAFGGSIQAASGGDRDYAGPGTVFLEDRSSGSRSLIVDNLGREGRAAGLTDPGATAWSFDELELRGEGNLELLDAEDTVDLAAGSILGDGSARLIFNGDLELTRPALAAFGLRVNPGARLVLPPDFTLSGVELLNFGSIEAASEITLDSGVFTNQGPLPPLESLVLEAAASAARLDASAGTSGDPPGTYRIGSVTVGTGARLEAAGDADSGVGLSLLSEEVVVESGGYFTADGLGYTADSPGPGTGDLDGGGGHGGWGAGTNGGVPYGSAVEPTDLGSPGGLLDTGFGTKIRGTSGGGAIKIEAQRVQVDGVLSADGASTEGGQNAGSGGSLWVVAEVLTGSGAIRANGGQAPPRRGPTGVGGAGGRIAIEVTDDEYSGELQAAGRGELEFGGPGTIYRLDAATGFARLIVDNLGVEARPGALTDPEATTWSFDAVELRRFGHLELLDPEDSLALDPASMFGDGTAMVFLQRDTEYPFQELPGFGFHVPAGVTLTLPDRLRMVGSRSHVEGAITPLEALDLVAGDEGPSWLRLTASGSSAGESAGTYRVGDLSVDPEQLLELASDPASGRGVTLLTGSASIGGRLSADGLGHTPSANGPGAPSSTQYGAGHGGRGGGPGGGGTYGSIEEPTTLGSASQTAGGGAMRLIGSGPLTVLPEGAISADGAAPANSANGGAAGGSVWITAPSVLGDGSIRADGGSVPTLGLLFGYGGGGGRVKVDTDTLSPDLVLRADGGTGAEPGEDGTVLVESAGFPTDVALRLTAPAEAIPGRSFEYGLVVRNEGVTGAEEVALTVELPTEVNYISDNAPVAVSQAGSQLTWSFGEQLPGSKISFSLIVDVAADAPLGSEILAEAAVTTSTEEDDTADNTAAASTALITGYSFEASIEPLSQSLNLGADGEYRLAIRNTGILPDSYGLGVVGLDPEWFELARDSVSLSPGGEVQISLRVQAQSCAAAGSHPFQIEIAPRGDATAQTLEAQLELQGSVAISDVKPDPGVNLGARDVLFSWRTDAPATSTLALHPLDEPDQVQTFSTELGRTHSVLVEGLERNTTYEWSVEAISDCGSGALPARRFTVTNGIVFTDRAPTVTIDRDYNQRASIEVRNDDSVPHSVRLAVEEPYEDLIVNFVGSGSVDQAITLGPGESRQVSLAVHAQDAASRDYDLTAVLTADEGGDAIRDSVRLRLDVLFENDFTLEELSTDPLTGAKTYRITNNGSTITDLAIRAVNPATGEPARVYLTPAVNHARLETGESLTFEVFPLFDSQDVAPEVAASGRGPGLAAPAVAGIPFELEASVGDVVRRLKAEVDCGGGKQVFPVTLSDVYLTFPVSDWYCTNKRNITIPFQVPAFVNPANVIDATLQGSFSPRTGEVRDHSAQIGLNGALVHAFVNETPNGTYTWNAPEGALRGGALAGTVTQEITINSQHPNEGHYSVASGFVLGAAVDEATIYVCANSQEEAEAIVNDLYNPQPLPQKVTLGILEPLGDTATPNAEGRVLVQARVVHDLEGFPFDYPVQATIEYLDAAEVPADEFSLFDDGLSEHGDGFEADGVYSFQWHPQASGRVGLTVTVDPPGKLGPIQRTKFFDVQQVTDLAVTTVFTDPFPRAGELVTAIAEVSNLGAEIDQPVLVEFSYFDVDDDTGEPVGAPLGSSPCLLFAEEGAVFTGGSAVKVLDQSYLQSEAGLFFASVRVSVNLSGLDPAPPACQTVTGAP